MFTVSLPATVLNVALPTLATALDVGAGELPWLVASYLLAVTVALLPAGLLADRLGCRLVLLVGLGLFAGGSALAAGAPSAGVFITAQALSGAILAGPVLSHLWWGWAFLTVVPVLAAVAATAVWTVPESRAGTTGTGARALAAGLGRLLSGRRFVASSLLAAAGMFVLFGVLFGAPQYFQVVLDLDPAGSGVRPLPLLAGSSWREARPAGCCRAWGVRSSVPGSRCSPARSASLP